MSQLRELQALHVQLTAKLITFAYAQGYTLGWGQTLRTQGEANANAATGAGISNSLHTVGLAIDLNLYRDGRWLMASEDHRPLGEYWKSLHPLCRWGGDFIKGGKPKPDGNHYSVEYQGIK